MKLLKSSLQSKVMFTLIVPKQPLVLTVVLYNLGTASIVQLQATYQVIRVVLDKKGSTSWIVSFSSPPNLRHIKYRPRVA